MQAPGYAIVAPTNAPVPNCNCFRLSELQLLSLTIPCGCYKVGIRARKTLQGFEILMGLFPEDRLHHYPTGMVFDTQLTVHGFMRKVVDVLGGRSRNLLTGQRFPFTRGAGPGFRVQGLGFGAPSNQSLQPTQGLQPLQLDEWPWQGHARNHPDVRLALHPEPSTQNPPVITSTIVSTPIIPISNPCKTTLYSLYNPSKECRL